MAPSIVLYVMEMREIFYSSRESNLHAPVIQPVTSSLYRLSCVYVRVALCVHQLQSVSLTFSFNPFTRAVSPTQSATAGNLRARTIFFCSLAYRILKNSLKVLTSSF